MYDSEWTEKVLAHHKKQRMETSQQSKTSMKWKCFQDEKVNHMSTSWLMKLSNERLEPPT